jgi:hypothetical protein
VDEQLTVYLDMSRFSQCAKSIFIPLFHFPLLYILITFKICFITCWYHACSWLAAAAECMLDIEALVRSDNCHLEGVIECTEY